jgi:uncharacterized protein with ParB-like and HNH nuclease domain
MDLKPVPNLVGLEDTLKSDGIPYSEVRMAAMQRGYEWEKRNLLTFFNDSVSEIGKSYPQNTNFKGPFLGVMIVTEYITPVEPGLAPEPKTCEIVDGQQRITSSFLLISILRDHLIQLAAEMDDAIKLPSLGSISEYDAKKQLENCENWISELLKFLYFDALSASRKPRLVSWPAILNIMEQTVFAPGSHISETGISKSDVKNKQTKRFAEAVLTLRKAVSEHLGSIQAANASMDAVKLSMIQSETLIELAKVVLQRFFVVKLYTPNPNDSAEVFLSLNSKGKALSSQDIIKAQLLNSMQLSKSDQNDFSTAWSQMQKKVDDANEYLRISWIVSRNEKASPRNIASLVTKDIASDSKTRSEQAWKEFRDNADFYEALLRPKANAIRLPTSNKFTITQLVALADVVVSYRILALKLLSLAKNLNAAEKSNLKFEEFVRNMYVLAFAGRTKYPLPQKLEDRYIQLANMLTDISQVQAVLDELKSDVDECLVGFSVSNLSKEKQLLILHALEETHRQKQSKVSIGWKENEDSIEHTAPQKFTPVWMSELTLSSATDEKIYKQYMTNLGNLALLNGVQNSKIKRKPWEDPAAPTDKTKSKRAAYKNADFDTTIDLAIHKTWDKNIVVRREQWIVKTIKKVFDTTSGSYQLYEPFA